ncbi:hypothetical protein LTR86_010039 [Recurvomyces mirabilis]|nr:hypothetical protein LTR86_010039 [Recurvomyces mirabilis]
MTNSDLAEWQDLMGKAAEYHKKALWQEKLRCLQEAQVLCERPGFPDATARRQDILFDLGAMRRRLGQYGHAEVLLNQALDAFPDAEPLKRAYILGELSVVLRHRNRFLEARDASRAQYRLAYDSPSLLERDVELCRAIGNEGMSAYNMSQQSDCHDTSLLPTAFLQLRERVERARELQKRIEREQPQSRWANMAKSWETIGMDRLTLCYVASGQTAKAVELAEDSQSRQTREDPTVTAYSKFFYGNALWHHGRQAEALAQWNAPNGHCSSPMVFCKEPAKEHTEYLRLMASAGADFDSYDEQGFSALDYAILSDNPDAKESLPVLEGALRKNLTFKISQAEPELPNAAYPARIDKEISDRFRQGELRRQYRTLLQEQMRPELRNVDSSLFKRLRSIYARYLKAAIHGTGMLSDFRYVKYHDFLNHGRLPISGAGLTQIHRDSSEEDPFVVFFSYRWLCHDKPDTDDNTQWKRMLNAVDGFLAANKDIRPEQLAIWVDYACIDQDGLVEKARGVDSLPLAVTLCNAMISLVDETYYTRAWCAVEVLMMQAVLSTYDVHQWWSNPHQWWEHKLDSDTDGSNGTLHKSGLKTFDVSSLRLSHEKSDRPKIEFLNRQSRLLGKDDNK